MKIPGWTPYGIHMSPAAKRDALLFPAVFTINCFFFSPWLRILSHPWLMIAWVYGIAVLIPLIWRDKVPVTIFAVQWVFAIVAWPFIDLYSPVSGIPLALYAVAVHRNKRESLLALLTSAVPIVVCSAMAFKIFNTFETQVQSFIPNVILLSIVTVGAWGAGRVTRAGQLHVQQLERERETVQEAVAAERSRIARELHDIVSHAVTAIVLQAAGAARVAKTNFAQVTQSLQNIETTGKQAMAELRRLLGVLEASDSTDRAAGMGELGPQPGLADMALLLTSFKDTGMPVTVHVEGTPRNLDPSIDLAAYRIVQEGLTNVLKHAGMDSHPQLRMVWKADSLLIQIDNDINQAQARHGQALSVGRGLVGLRARAQAAGGRLHSGPHHNGGYRLSAILPFADTPQRALSDAGVARASTEEQGNNGKVSA